LGEDGLKRMTRLLTQDICAIGEPTKDYFEVTMIALKKKPKATKCNDHRTVTSRVHTAKLVAKILLNKKFKTCMEEISLDVEEKKEYRWKWDTENSIIKNFEYR
jgi:hypothetical protein